jgi:hypothetical protein
VSYLTLPDGIPSFSRAVFSLWFRVPQASIDAAIAGYDPDAGPQPFAGIIPILTFGQAVKQKRYTYETGPVLDTHTVHRLQWFNHPTCAWVEYASNLVTDQPAIWHFTGVEDDIESSFIGVDCTSGTPVLSVNAQMPDNATLDGSWPYPIAISADAYYGYDTPFIGGEPPCANPPAVDVDGNLVPFTDWTQTTTYASGGPVVLGNAPERFRNQYAGGPSGGPATPTPVITADTWHHLLWSLDLTEYVDVRGVLMPSGASPPPPPGSVYNACRMWIALDDVNLTGADLSYYWPEGYTDPNAILTPSAYETLHTVEYYDNYNDGPIDNGEGNYIYHVGLGLNAASCTYYPSLVPAHDLKLGIPATDDYTARIQHVMLAELQMFTGIHLETGITANRRAFISADGKPVNPHKLATPEDPQQGSIALLGKTPDVLLHGTGDWKTGTNTGPDYVPNPGPPPPETIPDPVHKLTPTGKIDGYTPNPALGA